MVGGQSEPDTDHQSCRGQIALASNGRQCCLRWHGTIEEEFIQEFIQYILSADVTANASATILIIIMYSGVTKPRQMSEQNSCTACSNAPHTPTTWLLTIMA